MAELRKAEDAETAQSLPSLPGLNARLLHEGLLSWATGNHLCARVGLGEGHCLACPVQGRADTNRLSIDRETDSRQTDTGRDRGRRERPGLGERMIKQRK